MPFIGPVSAVCHLVPVFFQNWWPNPTGEPWRIDVAVTTLVQLTTGLTMFSLSVVQLD